MSKVSKTTASGNFKYSVYKNGSLVTEFSSPSTRWEDIKENIEGQHFSSSQHRVFCVNNAIELQLPSAVIGSVVPLPGKDPNDIVLSILPKESKAGAFTRPELYGLVKEILAANPALKSEFARNYTQTPTADLEAFVAKHSGGKKAPAVKATTTSSKPSAPKPPVAGKAVSASGLSNEDLLNELKRRGIEADVPTTTKPVATKEDPAKRAVQQFDDEYYRNNPRARR